LLAGASIFKFFSKTLQGFYFLSPKVFRKPLGFKKLQNSYESMLISHTKKSHRKTSGGFGLS